MHCPKCGREVHPGAFICPGCEFILDTSFLGDDITDDDHEKRLAANAALKAKGSKSGEFGEDAIILGDGQGEYSDFSSKDAGGLTREVTQARFYIGGSTAALLHPDAVPEPSPAAVQGSLKMSPFERHVLNFINGKRSIGRIQKKSAMEDSEFKVAISMLADKGIIRLRTTKKKKKPGSPPSRSESLLPSRSESNMAAPRPDSAGADRTVVAAFPGFPEAGADDGGGSNGRHSAIAAAAALDDDNVDNLDDVLDARARSHGEATIIKGADAAKKQSRMPGFASMRIAEGDDDAPKGVVDEARADAWGGDENPNNISNVFARATPTRPKKSPSLADAPASPAVPPPLPDDVSGDQPLMVDGPVDEAVNEEFLPPGDDDDFFRKNSTGPQRPVRSRTDQSSENDLPLALRDPTGLGDMKPVNPGAGAGDALGSDVDSVDGFVSAENIDEDVGSLYDDATGEPGGGHGSDVPTGPPPGDRDDSDQRSAAEHDESDERAGHDESADADADAGDGDDEDDARSTADDNKESDDADGFDVDLRTLARPNLSSAQTASLPASPPNLPSDALRPLPSSAKLQAPPPSSPTAVAPVRPVPSPPPMTVQPPPPMTVQPPPPSVAAMVPGLPGQALQRSSPGVPGLPGQSLQARPGTKGGLMAPRPSAGSKVPFEQARKAEKIFEQAVKDHTEGRLSSARMNAKLAVMYDPSIETYAEFLKELDAKGAAAEPPGGRKSRELQLFEAAAEAEGVGNYDKAVDLLEEAVSVNPKAAALRNRLGVVLSIRLKRHVEAMEQLKIAIDLEPGNIVYMNNFSKVTALLDSQLQNDPMEKKKKGKINEKVEIKKMRPKMF